MNSFKKFLFAFTSTLAIISLSACNQTPTTSGLHSEPSFDAISDKPITLRTKFTPGLIFNSSMATVMKMNMLLGSETMSVDMDMSFEGEYRVLEVDDSQNALIEITIKRLRMDMDLGPSDKMSIDSKYPETIIDEFRPVMAMLNVSMPVKINSLGKIIEFDRAPVVSAMQDSGADVQMVSDMSSAIDEYVHYTFIEFPTEPLKVGDTIKGPSLQRALSGLGSLQVDYKYHVLSVSADHQQVLFLIDSKITFDLSSSPINIDIDDISSIGWLLLNAENGRAVASSQELTMKMGMSQGGQSIDMNVTAVTNHKETK